MGWFENLKNNYNDTANSVSSWWNDVPKASSDQDFLKQTVFKGQVGFSSVESMSKENVEKFLSKHFDERFKDVPPDQMPKSFSEEERKMLTEELLGASFASAPESAKAYLLDKVSDVLSNKYDDAWYAKVGKWTTDTALPAIGSAATTVYSLTPLSYVNDGMGYVSSKILESNPSLKGSWGGQFLQSQVDGAKTVSDARNEASQAIYGFGKFAVENPGRALSLTGQGITNAATSTVGMIWDGARFIVYDVGIKGGIVNGSIALKNAFSDEQNKTGYVDLGKWNRHSEWLNEKTQFAARIQPVNADGTENTNANYERVLLYGPQAAAEVVLVVAASAVTGGAAGAGWAAARGTAMTARTVGVLSQVKKVEAVVDASKLLDKVYKAEKALVGAEKVLAEASTAKNILSAEQKVAQASERLAAATQKAYTPKFSLKMKEVENIGATTQDFVQSSARQLEKAKEALEVARAAGKGEAQIQKLAQKVGNLEAEIVTNAAKAERVGARVAETTDVLKFQDITYGRNILETAKNWAHKGARFTDPRLDGYVGKVLNTAGVGLTFAFGGGGESSLGFVGDNMAAKQEVAQANALREQMLQGAGMDSATLDARAQNMDEQYQQILAGEDIFDLSPKKPPAQATTDAPAQDNLSPNFNATGERGAGNDTSGGQSNSFNNNASGIIIKVDPALIDAMKNNQNQGGQSTDSSLVRPSSGVFK